MTEQLRKLREILATAGFPSVVDRVVAAAKPALGFTAVPLDGEAVPIGASRIGGLPDLSSRQNWPEKGGAPLAFLAQLDLSDLASFECCADLPTVGLLSFFYDQEQQAWGFDPEDRGSWSVQYEADRESLVRTPARAGLTQVFPSRVLTFRPKVTIPPWDSEDFRSVGLSQEESDAYFDALDEIDEYTDESGEHQVFGHPIQIQGDMSLECQLVANGIYCGDSSGYNSEKAKLLKSGWKEWQLLLQLDSDDSVEMMWGDLGTLYFWIREADLRAGRFGETWMILQCT